MSKQSRLNKEKAARAKASQEGSSNNANRGVDSQRQDRNSGNEMRNQPQQRDRSSTDNSR